MIGKTKLAEKQLEVERAEEVLKDINILNNLLEKDVEKKEEDLKDSRKRLTLSSDYLLKAKSNLNTLQREYESIRLGLCSTCNRTPSPDCKSTECPDDNEICNS